MNQLSDDHLTTLAGHLVTGPHTPGHAVMARGRALRRRRQFGGTAVLAAAMTTGAILSPHLLASSRQEIRDPATATPATTTPATGATEVPADQAGTCRPETRLADVPELVHLVADAGTPLVATWLMHNDVPCSPRPQPALLSGIRQHGDVVTQSFVVYPPGAQIVAGLPGGARSPVTVRGLPGTALTYQQDTFLTWTEQGGTWTFEGRGMTVAQSTAVAATLLLSQDEVLGLDGGTVPGFAGPGAGLTTVTKLFPPPNGGSAFEASYGSVNEDGDTRTGRRGWTLHVSNDWVASAPPELAAYPGDTLARVGDRKVLLGGPLTRAVWTDDEGNVFSLSGPLTPSEALTIRSNVVKVAPDDPRVVSVFQQPSSPGVSGATPGTPGPTVS